MKRIAVIGVGQTKFGEHWNKSLRELAVEAGATALQDAELNIDDIQALHVGSMSPGTFACQEHVAALISHKLGMRHIPAVRYEAACASGSVAFRQACISVASGAYDTVMVIGVEKMTDLNSGEVISSLMAAGDHEWESSIGMTFSGLFALIARAHMHAFGTTREQMAMVAVNNHLNSINNKLAQYRYKISVDDVLNSSMVADPLRLMDCSPITDGAAAVIITNKPNTIHPPVWVRASEQAGDTLALYERQSLTEMAATKFAAKKAYEKAGITPQKINVAEVHDCFSINEIIALEDLGFCEKGKGGPFIEDHNIAIDGIIPTNTTGGLKAIGHPVGATGIRQIIDISKQLRGDSVNQVDGAINGIAMNIGGTGATAVITILSRDV